MQLHTHPSLLFLSTLLVTVLGSTSSPAVPLGIPDRVAQEIQDSHHAPQGVYTAVPSWDTAAKGMSHGIGRAVDDPAAESGHAWEARSTIDTAEGYLLYGPYLDLSPGDYVAFFRLKLQEEAGAEPVASIDSCLNFGHDTLAAMDLNGTDLSVGKYVQVPLLFHYPGGKLECRLQWTGYSSLRVDGVSLFRITGARIDKAGLRAAPAVASGDPHDLTPLSEPRPFPDIFPRSAPPAKDLFVFDMKGQTPDWELCVFTLQGLVNRSKPGLYCLANRMDLTWLNWMKRRGWVQRTHVIRGTSDLLARYKSQIKGMIITDPAVPATKNVATMIASIKDGIVVSPRMAHNLSLPVLDDLRGRWTKNVDAYRWAFDHLWDQLNHHVIACSYPNHLALRDYLVENRVFIFWISGPIDGARPYADPTAEVRLAEQILAKMPANTPVLSYPWAATDVGIGEGPGVGLFAEFGKYLVGSVDCSNLSVHSGIRVADFHQKIPPTPRLQRDKAYFSFIMSDGDNLPVLTVYNFPQLWNDPLRGKIPIGWSISPSSTMLIPDIVDYYYSTATPDDAFLAAVSGIGYTYPDLYGKRFAESERKGVFDGFLAQTAAYMQKLDLKIIWPMNITSPDLFRRYALQIPTLQAIFPDYGRRVSTYDEATTITARNVPVFHAVTNWHDPGTDAENVNFWVSQIQAIAAKHRPAFLHVFLWNWGTKLPMLKEVMDRLGPEYVAVRPEQLAALYKEELSRQPLLATIRPELPVLGGRPTSVTLLVSNVAGAPQHIDASILAGFKNGNIQPAQLSLNPGDQSSIEVAGIPDGPALRIELKSTAGTQEVETELREIPANELASPVAGDSELRFAGHFEADAMGHLSGKLVQDADASAHQAWSADSDTAKPGHIVFGPYAPLDPGEYVALFRIKRTGAGAGILAILDTSADGGTNVTRQKEVTDSDLPVGAYRSFPLTFHHPGGPLETRVNWTGLAPLRVDCIDVWKVRTPAATPTP